MGLEHIETQEVTGATSSVDFTNVFDRSADRYILYCDNLVITGSDFDQPYLQYGVNGSFETSGYNYSNHRVRPGGSGSQGASSESNIELAYQQIGNDPSSNETCICKIEISNPENSSRATVSRYIYANYVNDNFSAEFGGGHRSSNESVDSIRIGLDNDSISSGIFSLYAVTEYSGSSKDHIHTIEANSQSTVDFDNVFGSSDGYDRYEIKVDGVLPSQDADLQMRVSSDGGSTFDSGSSDYAYSEFLVDQTGGTVSGGNGSFSSIPLSFVTSTNSSIDTASMTSIISNPTNSNRATVVRTDGVKHTSTSSKPLVRDYRGGIRLAQTAVDSIRFLMSSGNISEGQLSVYGIGGN